MLAEHLKFETKIHKISSASMYCRTDQNRLNRQTKSYPDRQTKEQTKSYPKMIEIKQ